MQEKMSISSKNYFLECRAHNFVGPNSLNTPKSGPECYKNALRSGLGLCLMHNGEFTVVAGFCLDSAVIDNHCAVI